MQLWDSAIQGVASLQWERPIRRKITPTILAVILFQFSTGQVRIQWNAVVGFQFAPPADAQLR